MRTRPNVQTKLFPLLIANRAHKGLADISLFVRKVMLSSSITLSLYGYPLSYFWTFQASFYTQSQSQPIRSDRDLFFAIDRLNQQKELNISKLILSHRQYVTLRLWQWISAQASLQSKTSGFKLTSRRYKSLLVIARALEDDRLIGISHYTIGRHLALSGRYLEAIEAYKQSCILLERAHRDVERLQVLSSLSQLYITIGDMDAAQKHAEQILLVIRSRDKRLKPSGPWSEDYVTANALSVLASIDYRNGHYPKAIPKYLEALELYQRSEIFPPLYGADICATLNNLGEIYSILGDYRLAFKYLTQSLELANDRSLLHKEIETLLNLGSLYLKQDNYARSEEYFKRSEQRSLENHSELNQAKSLLGLGITAFKQSHLERSLAYFRQCLKITVKLKDPETTILVRQHLGAVLHEQGRFSDALAEFNSSELLARRNGDVVSIAELLWRKAEAQISLQNYKLARELAEESRHLAEQLGSSKLLQLSSTTIAETFLKAGLLSQSIQQLTGAIEQIEKMRGDIIGGIQSQQLFFEKRVGVYHTLIDILIGQHDNIEVLNYAERAKGRLLYEQLNNKQQRTSQSLSPDEKLKEKSFNKEIADLNRLIYQEKVRSTANQTRLSQLNSKLSVVREKYSQFRDLLTSQYDGRLSYLKSPPSISEATLTQTPQYRTKKDKGNGDVK
jgi:tetratricopeptide (TPR) repeat protein